MAPILPLSSTEITLETAGGKGANLARLARSGFPVPRGFIIATDAYRLFIAHNALGGAVAAALKGLEDVGPAAADGAEQATGSHDLEAASAAIRAAFSQGRMPAGLRSEIVQAYARLQSRGNSHPLSENQAPAAGLPVAVRSSATTEDLPDLSFAGQQDTFLNVTGEQQLLQAVVNCWSSLWTARAIGYRRRNAIAHDHAALAVVVQEMVPADCSGVLFTANPLSGLRSETVIDATFGLGEALVSGQVEPDHFVYDLRAGRLLQQSLGAKQLATRARSGGGVQNVPTGDEGRRAALTAEQVRALALLGQRIQAEFGAPQDIEWAIAGDEVLVLQSRPITSLFPVPQISFDPLEAWFAFGSVQGVVGPITPLGRDIIVHLLTGAGQLFNRRLKPEEQSVVAEAGERLWIKISDLLRHPLGARIYGQVAGLVDPGAVHILSRLASDPYLHLGQGKHSLRTYVKIVVFAVPIVLKMARNMLRPQRARARFDAAVEQYLASSHIAPGGDRFERLADVTAHSRRHLTNAFPFLLPRFLPVFAPGMASFSALRRLAGDAHQDLVLEMTRSLPGNVTTEMDLALWAAARAIGADAAALRLFHSTSAAALARLALDGALPPAAQSAVDQFLARYGMRGVGEIDMGRPRWREDPTPVMQSLKSYLQIDPERAPDALFARGALSAREAIERLAAVVRRQRGGRLKEKAVHFLARRMRIFMGYRESPKFCIIRAMGPLRTALLDVGQEFVDAGTLERGDDLFFLTLDELASLARREEGDWAALVTRRRAAHDREQRRRQVPRVLVSDGRAIYEGLGAPTGAAGADGDLSGSPVSPGVVEGRVHIIFDPHGAQLAPGEILVCPGTDPAWTPLFMAAGGLITEVGGMMTHGSVVAREVGIPAVVGVHMATQRLKDGQKIRLDGSTGKILVLDHE